MEINWFLPNFNFSEKHRKFIPAPRDIVYKTFKKTDFCDSFLIRSLIAIRGIKVERFRVLFEKTLTLLAENPNKEVLYGLVAKPWKLDGEVVHVNKFLFKKFDQPGFAKIVWNFSFEDHNEGTIVSTETRIYCTDSASRLKFACYWFFIKPVSGLMRIFMLNLISKRVLYKLHIK